MQTIASRLLLAAAGFLCVPAFAADSQPAPEPKQPAKAAPSPRPRLSPHETISAYCAGDRRTGSLVTITYGRPYSAKGGKGEARKIWGELVKWDHADRLGADEATLILLHDPIEIRGATIPAGAYTLYLVPSHNGATKLAFSTHIGKWGVPVDEQHDLTRVDLDKEELPDQIDQLTLALDSTATGGVLRIMWEKTQFSVAFTVRKP